MKRGPHKLSIARQKCIEKILGDFELTMDEIYLQLKLTEEYLTKSRLKNTVLQLRGEHKMRISKWERFGYRDNTGANYRPLYRWGPGVEAERPICQRPARKGREVKAPAIKEPKVSPAQRMAAGFVASRDPLVAALFGPTGAR